MSVRCKAIKDPVYGYVEVPVGIVKSIINTPVFQRLRRIAQTSYEPLYPSATHNRFVHSLGVYFLGRIVTSCIRDESFGMLFKEQGNGIRERYDRYITRLSKKKRVGRQTNVRRLLNSTRRLTRVSLH